MADYAPGFEGWGSPAWQAKQEALLNAGTTANMGGAWGVDTGQTQTFAQNNPGAQHWTPPPAPAQPAAQPQYGAGWGASGYPTGGAYQPGIANDPNGGGAMGSNPYRSDVLGFLKNDMLDFTGKALQGNRSNFVGAGGLGGSRQGIAEGEIINNAGRNYGTAAANMLSGDYQFDRGLQTGSYNTNRALDLQQAGLGMQAMTQGMSADWGPTNQASNIYGNYTGFGNTGMGSQGGGWLGALGGALAGGQFASNMKWF